MQRGVAADAVTFTALISAWARACDVDRALQVRQQRSIQRRVCVCVCVYERRQR
jgi:pentatricopeptide repeat protein